MEELTTEAIVIMVVLGSLAILLIPMFFLSFMYVRSVILESMPDEDESATPVKKQGYDRKIIDKTTGKEISLEELEEMQKDQ